MINTVSPEGFGLISDAERKELNMQHKKKETSFGKTLDMFHKTEFSFSNAWRMALEFFILYAIMSVIIALAEKFAGITNQGTDMVLNFIFIELLPVLITGLTFAIKRRYATSEDAARHAIHIVWTWIKYFAKDLWTHKVTVAFLVIGFLFVESFIGVWQTKLFFSGHTQSHVNDKLIMTLMHKNMGMILATTLIAPLTEELFFRFWSTGMIKHLINWMFSRRSGNRIYICLATVPITVVLEYFLAGRALISGLYGLIVIIALMNKSNACHKILIKLFSSHKSSWAFWYAAVVSAVGFASLHLDGQSILTGLTYVATALILQFIMRRTKSLTAPVLVHSLSNLLVVGARLLM